MRSSGSGTFMGMSSVPTGQTWLSKQCLLQMASILSCSGWFHCMFWLKSDTFTSETDTSKIDRHIYQVRQTDTVTSETREAQNLSNRKSAVFCDSPPMMFGILSLICPLTCGHKAVLQTPAEDELTRTSHHRSCCRCSLEIDENRAGALVHCFNL